MLDHIGLRVSNFERSKAFYEQVLKPLGYGVEMAFEHEGISAAGFGSQGKPSFWISEGQPAEGLHLAFAASNRAAVDAFYAAALAAGATDNGAPGPRPQYHPGYYGAFVLDLDGHNIEAVCHRPE
ncbi:MAG: glyoxalase/bleomycin resistance/extradiol dioxygenase family protein [Candidatus Melainabacteria bacterium HGW-Melainabacteria-1]|nr:MAG: glyoxalase/bleomycin resistance/extradiol dioxygenase family protein [Candidatus Melainabacteria bacterium HGW-Melainabacteria-1]